MPTCSSKDLCKDFLVAAQKVLDQAAKIHTVTPAEDGYCVMPDNCGPTVWAVLHGLAAAMRDEVCSHCGEEAVQIVSAIHDHVNAKLGKPLYNPKNYDAVIGDMSAKHAVAMSKLSAQKNEQRKAAKAAKASLHQEDHMMQRIDVSSFPQDREVGAPLCRTPQGVVPGAWSQGGHDHVDVELICPDGRYPIGTVHSHPDGVPEPSPQDWDVARRLGLDVVCIIQPQTGEMVCQPVHG